MTVPDVALWISVGFLAGTSITWWRIAVRWRRSAQRWESIATKWESIAQRNTSEEWS